ncbi:MAG: hypothetical protein MUF57_08985 [Gammaproteobacteria bacterium]|jgi:hypothetical protein|nr:hypothetical protein [Gammaproteobacteria bacterium]
MTAASGNHPAASVGYHVGLDTMMGYRSRHRPEEVGIDGFLLFDTGDYELVTAHVPLDVFWTMKSLDVVGHARTASRARAARQDALPQVGSVWLVDGELEHPVTGPINSGASTPCTEGRNERLPRDNDVRARTTDRSGSSADDAAEAIFRLRVHAVYALDLVAIEPVGPQIIETLLVCDMLPGFRTD